MSILLKVVLELSGPRGPVRADADVSRPELDEGVATMVFGGIDGALVAINSVIGEQGYKLKRVPQEPA